MEEMSEEQIQEYCSKTYAPHVCRWLHLVFYADPVLARCSLARCRWRQERGSDCSWRNGSAARVCWN
eukprot:750174-Hanusia_phi.AAC.1